MANAIVNSPGGIAIAVVQWSSITRQALGLDWVSLHDLDDVERYAAQVAAMPRRIPGGGTMIHSGLEFSARMLDAAPGTARRRVIDLAGNGQSDDPPLLAETRDRLLSQGVVINGLAIEEDDDELTRYFGKHVIGGAQSFVITASDFDDFARAMHIKLLREIGGPVFAGTPRADEKPAN